MSIFERCAIVLLLCVFDTIFTIYHVSMGASELNPILAFCLETSTVFFFIVKILFTSILCLILMLACTNDLRFKMVGAGLNIIIAVYVTLCLYHFYLFLMPSLVQHSYM